MFKFSVVDVQHIPCYGSTGALCDLVVDIVRCALGALVAVVVICCVQVYCSGCATYILFWCHRCVMRSCG